MKGGLGVFAMRIVALFLAFGAETLITNTLGLEQYDLWATAASWLALLTVLCSLGMNTALIKHLPADWAHQRFAMMRGMINWTGKRMFFTGCIVGGTFFIGRDLIMGQQMGLAAVLGVVALMFPIQALNLHRQAVLTGLKHPVLALLPDQLVRISVLIALIFPFALSGTGLSAVGLAWIWLGSLCVALAVGVWCKWRMTPIEVHLAKDQTDPIDWVKTAKPLMIMHLGGMLISQADPAMLGLLSNPGQAGLFAVANRIALLLAFGLAAVNTIAAPLISQLHATGEKRELQAMLRLAAKGIALFTIPTGAFVILASPWLLSLFGPEFTAAHKPLCWLVAGQTINALAGSVGFILTMTGHQVIAARIIYVAAIGKITLSFFLLPAYGALGAAIGSAIMLAFWNIWLWIEVRRRLQLEPTILALFKNTTH